MVWRTSIIPTKCGELCSADAKRMPLSLNTFSYTHSYLGPFCCALGIPNINILIYYCYLLVLWLTMIRFSWWGFTYFLTPSDWSEDIKLPTIMISTRVPLIHCLPSHWNIFGGFIYNKTISIQYALFPELCFKCFVSCLTYLKLWKTWIMQLLCVWVEKKTYEEKVLYTIKKWGQLAPCPIACCNKGAFNWF